jgi:hypothetical protein
MFASCLPAAELYLLNRTQLYLGYTITLMFKTLTGSDLVLTHGLKNNGFLAKFNRLMRQTLTCCK